MKRAAAFSQKYGSLTLPTQTQARESFGAPQASKTLRHPIVSSCHRRLDESAEPQAAGSPWASANNPFWGHLARIRCNVRRCMLSWRDAFKTLRPLSS